jgi:hypothetical protein
MIRTFSPLILLAIAAVVTADDPPAAGLKTERFDRDPGWEGHNNRIVPAKPRTVTQDFGYSPTKLAGKAKGEAGGTVTRAAKPAYYGRKFGPKTLDQNLSASGSFAFTKTTSGSGLFFGFFNADQPGGGGRPVQSLGMDFDGEGEGGRLAVRLITSKNQSCGTFITPFIPGKFRPIPIRHDGTRYRWTLDYDPTAAGGRGRFTFTLTSDAHKSGELEKPGMPESHLAEARRRFPTTTTFAVDLPEGYKQHGTTFDHFGLMNMMKAGGTMSAYFGDLTIDGKAEDFAADPKWAESGNRATYLDRDQPGTHDFGFSDTGFAGGKPGELGGGFWRSGKFAYYADRVGPLSLDDRLEARGRVVLKVGAPDSDMFFGWFDGKAKEKSPAEAGHFLGVHVGGPTRVGHYFHPMLMTGKGTKAMADGGPVLAPNKVYDFTIVYDPAAEGGRGSVRVTLGTESVTLVLRPGVKAQGAVLDRFGVLTSNIGGQLVRVYFDDLTYTAARPAR